MADKPKTYAQQVQDLKAERTQLLNTIEELRNNQDDIPQMREEIKTLKEQLAAKSKEDSGNASNSKAKLTDAQQLAESEAVRARGLQNHNRELQEKIGQLETRIAELSESEATIARLKGKMEQYETEAKEANRDHLATLQQLRDTRAEFSNYRDQAERRLSQLQTADMQQKQFIQDQAANYAEKLRVTETQRDNVAVQYQKLADEYQNVQNKLLRIHRALNQAPDVLSQVKDALGGVAIDESTEQEA